MESKRALEEFSLLISEEITNYKIELKGYDQILAFFQSEHDFWSKCKIKNEPIGLYIQHYQEVLANLEELEKSIVKHLKNNTLETHWGQIKQVIGRTKYQNRVVLFSKTPHAKYLAKLAKNNLDQVTAFFSFITGSSTNININQKQNFVGFLKGYEFIYDQESGFVGRRENEIESIQLIRNEWQQKTQDLIEEFNTRKNELEDWKTEYVQNNEELKKDLESWKAEFISENTNIQKRQEEGYTSLIDAAKKTINDLELLYRNKLSLEAPVDYWRKRIKKYRFQGFLWVGLLTLIVGIIGKILFQILYDMPEAFHHKLFGGEPEAIKGVIIFATIISFGAYLAKTFSRLTFSSFHLQRDSEEREQLTLVFLALIKDGVITEDERNLVLQSLFSRAETGLLGGEGSPTMPGVGGLVDKFCAK